MKPRRVALLIETSNAYARGLLRGIRSYARERGSWSMFLGEQRRGEAVPRWLSRWQGDGIIARIETKEIANTLRASKLKTVDVSAAKHLPEIPFVETDDAAIAAMAADHFLGRGFHAFAYSGDRRFQWSANRREGFQRCIERAGHTVAIHETAVKRRGWEAEHDALVRWLARLPKPVAIMACYDIRGWEILNACQDAGLAVPEEVAVIGVDDDELICDLSDPPLSSIIPDVLRTGYEAAALLDRMMAGDNVRHGGYLIPPLGVSVRQSTDVFAIEDENIRAALRFIRDHAFEGIHVDDVVAHVSGSRRSLESRFKELMGRTPHREILRVQLDRVKLLLTQTDLTLEAIAHRCGFQHAEYMGVVFKRIVGMTPGSYRKQSKPSNGG